MLKRFFNSSERPVYEKLKALCDKKGAEVHSKARLADIFRIENSGISDAEYRFALTSHFDFLVVGSDELPRFAVEFDGPVHKQDDQKQRDKLKNSLCARFDLPLLRITSAYLDREFRGMDLLTYFVEVWFVQEAIAAAYKTGALPADADVDATMLFASQDRKTIFPYWLGLDNRAELHRLHQEGKILSYSESCRVGIDKDGNYRCISYLQVREDKYVIAESGIRAQRFPIDESEVIIEITLSDLMIELERSFANRSLLESGRTLDKIIAFHEKNFTLVAGHITG